VLIPVVFSIFVRWLRLLPARGFTETMVGIGDLQIPVIFLTPWILMPLGVMIIGSLGGIVRMMRANVIDTLGQDFIRTAWAKGLPGRIVWWRHIVRNALVPIVTLIALSLGGLLAGGFFTETMFGIPGVGRLLVESIFDRDYPVIMATTLLYGAAFVVSNALADIVYGLVDPRIRVS
jgi:peptide/nickel transport system permease protein